MEMRNVVFTLVMIVLFFSKGLCQKESIDIVVIQNIEETYLPDSVKKGFYLIDTLQVALLKDIVIIETENLKKRYSKSIKKRRVDDNYFDLSKRSFQVFGYKNEKGELFAILNILPLDTPNMEIYHFSIDGGCKYMQLIFNLTSYKTVVCECNGVS
jgi:hypothetical protein